MFLLALFEKTLVESDQRTPEAPRKIQVGCIVDRESGVKGERKDIGSRHREKADVQIQHHVERTDYLTGSRGVMFRFLKGDTS